MFLNKNLPEKLSFKGKYASFKNIKFPKGLLYLAHGDGNQSGAEKDNRLLFRER